MSRRDFLSLAGRVAVLWGLGSSAVTSLAASIQALSTGRAPVLWLEGSNCSGCSISLLNSYPVLPLSVLTRHLSLQFHQTLSTIQGAPAVDLVNHTIAQGGYLLVVEGAVPVTIPSACRFGGENFGDHLQRAAQGASHIVAVGSCAAFGGIPAAPNNPTGAVDAISFLQSRGISKPFVRVPGCPPHPDWMIGTLVHLIQYGMPPLDSQLRPLKFYSKTVHSMCPLREMEDASPSGPPGCMEEYGCKGPSTYADCVSRGWNGVATSCLHSHAPCIGCTSQNFAQSSFHHWPVAQ
jgi:hydrogenase small subunit